MVDFGLTPPPSGFSSNEARWNWTISQLPGFVVRGYSGAQTLNSLREAGLGVGTQRFYDWWRDVLGVWQEGSRISNISGDTIPHDDSFGQAPSWQTQRYGWNFEINAFDEDTGLDFTVNYAFETSFKASIDDMTELIEEDVSTRYPSLYNKMQAGKITTGWLLES